MSYPYNMARIASQRVKGLPPLVLLGHTKKIWSVAFLPDGKEVISASEDGNTRRWRVADGCELGGAVREKGGVLAVVASSHRQWIATADGEKNITIWNTTTYEKVVVLEGHSDCVRSLAFSPDSERLVSGSEDKTVIVWNTTTGKRLLGPLIGHTNTIWCARFSPNGNMIASCDGGGGETRIWNGHSGKLLILPIEVLAVSLAWTPDNQQLIVGCKDGSIKCFASSSGSLLADWKAHINVINSIAVSPDGKFIASASSDKTVRLWDMTTSTQNIGPPIQCHDRVYSVAISPDGTHLVSGGRDNRVYIWSLEGMVPASSRSFVYPVPPEILLSTEGNSPGRPLAPPKTITNGQGKDPGSSVLLSSDGHAGSDSSIVKTFIPFGELPQQAP
ncbi:WD40 repeat-like protein [Paxillus ammoniavirescens]|nr:WD40 repeat-like protein [Paxillus ammoniavirescens]